MRCIWLVCLLLGTLAWAQAPAPSQLGPTPSTTKDADDDDDQPVRSVSKLAPSTAVLTIEGLCDDSKTKAPVAAKEKEKECETRITRAQFEELVLAIQPTMASQTRQQLAGAYPRLLVMAHEAEKRGLEHDARFRELMAFSRLQILSQALVRDVQDKASKISEKDVQDYYQSHQALFEIANLQRIFVPIRQKESPANGLKDAAAGAEDQSAAAMTKEATDLQKRAAAGEDFATLQKEAYQTSGLTGNGVFPSLTNLRRDRLPPGHSSVFDLKVGQVSGLINDSSGHYIYKMVSKSVQSQDEVEEEVRNRLRSERVEEAMRQIQDPFKIESNPAYFETRAKTASPDDLPTSGSRDH